MKNLHFLEGLFFKAWRKYLKMDDLSGWLKILSWTPMSSNQGEKVSGKLLTNNIFFFHNSSVKIKPIKRDVGKVQ